MSAVVPKDGNHRNLHGYSTQCEIMRSPGSSLSKNKLNSTWKQTVNSSAVQRQNTVITHFALFQE